RKPVSQQKNERIDRAIFRRLSHMGIDHQIGRQVEERADTTHLIAAKAQEMLDCSRLPLFYGSRDIGICAQVDIEIEERHKAALLFDAERQEVVVRVGLSVFNGDRNIRVLRQVLVGVEDWTWSSALKTPRLLKMGP